MTLPGSFPRFGSVVEIKSMRDGVPLSPMAEDMALRTVKELTGNAFVLRLHEVHILITYYYSWRIQSAKYTPEDHVKASPT